MADSIGNSVSILFNTNHAVSCSEDDWTGLRENTFIKFGNDKDFYKIASCSSYLYIKDFVVVGPNKIQINDNIGIALVIGDNVSISYKEHELFTVINPTNGGKGYKVNDKISLSGGRPSLNIDNGLSQVTIFTVTNIGTDGEILQVKLENKGKYIESPLESVAIIGGNGTGALFDVKYRITDNRTLVERAIIGIERGTHSTILQLDAALPQIKEGKLSVNKWQLYLTSNYAGADKINSQYSVLRDFTPHLNIPLVGRGMEPASLFNLAANLIDQKLKDLQDQIDKLR